MMRSDPLKLADFSRLVGAEESVKEVILRLIRSGPEDEKAKALPMMANFPPYLIFALSEASPEINTFFETNPELNERWKSRLRSVGYHDERITSFDKKVTLSVFSQFKGAALLSGYAKYSDSDKESPDALGLLNKAAEIGMYDALIKRIKIYNRHIPDEKDPDKAETLIAFVMKDIFNLSNLYWSTGCVDAGQLTFDIIIYYFHSKRAQPLIERFFGPIKMFSWRSYDSTTRPFPIIVLEKGMEYLYLAMLIADLPESKAITKSLVSSENPLTGLKGKLENPAKFEAAVLKILADLKVPLIDSFCTAAKEHAQNTLLKYYPGAQRTSNNF